MPCSPRRTQDEAETALQRLPANMRAPHALSPLNYLKDLHAPLIVQLHDRGDQVVPVGELRQLHAAIAGRAGVHYTEMQFSHLDPAKGKLPLPRLVSGAGQVLARRVPHVPASGVDVRDGGLNSIQSKGHGKIPDQNCQYVPMANR